MSDENADNAENDATTDHAEADGGSAVAPEPGPEPKDRLLSIIEEAIQVARSRPGSPEGTLTIRKLQEARHWHMEVLGMDVTPMPGADQKPSKSMPQFGVSRGPAPSNLKTSSKP